MATPKKKAAKKKTAKKKTAKRATKQKAPLKKPAKAARPSKATELKPGQIIMTDSTIVITLNAAEQRKAKACLKRTGKITFAVKEHSTTRLPAVMDNGKLID